MPRFLFLSGGRGRAAAVVMGVVALAGPAAALDHVAAIRSLGVDDVGRGQKLYSKHCAACHGVDGNLTQNPLARRFAADPLKFGADPYSLWKTLSYGNGLMFGYEAVLTSEQRYQVVHYIREAFLRRNGAQYVAPDAGYFAALPTRADADARAHQPAAPEEPVPAGLRDGRLGQAMLYGPAQSHSLHLAPPEENNRARFPGTAERALMVALPGEKAVGYDTERFSVAGLWTGRLVATEATHHRSYKGEHGLLPGGPVVYARPGDAGWRLARGATGSEAAPVVFDGHYLHGERVVLAATVAGRRVLELPGADAARPLYARTLEVGAGDTALECLVGRLDGGAVVVSGDTARVTGSGRTLHARLLAGGRGVAFRADAAGALWLTVPAAADAARFTVWLGFDEPIPAEGLSVEPALADLLRGGPRRWPEPVRTRVVRGRAIDGYAADELLVPFANPWGSWMRLSALDFFADGRIAVSTLSGDVWIVTVQGDDVVWSRFANGLYEPLGLRVVDDVVYVRTRDRIVRLRDLDADGEADFHESFYREPGEIGAGYHAFIFELQTDRTGNFYYSKSGRKTPHKSAIVRVSPDGMQAETIAGDLRHPNGLGFGGPGGWLTVADNPSGKAIFNGVALVREGASFGYEGPRNTPMLAVLPAVVDASGTGQCWSDPTRWGPLGGTLLHTSYSHGAMFYVLTQDLPPYPNGFAVRLPFGFKAGLMRTRVNPTDGQIYTVGLKGWDTHATYDGCLYRIRHTGEPTRLICAAAAMRTGVRFTFACDLDVAAIGPQAVTAAREVGKKGELAAVPLGAISTAGARTLEVAVPDLAAERVERRTTTDARGNAIVEVRPPIVFTISVTSADGHPINQIVYATINALP